MIQRREQLRFTFEPSEALRIPGDEFRQNLDCNVAIQVRIAGAIHFAHTARAEGGEDFVRPEASTGLQCHDCGCRDYIHQSSDTCRNWPANLSCHRPGTGGRT
jgi:hypothetical protein